MRLFQLHCLMLAAAVMLVGCAGGTTPPAPNPNISTTPAAALGTVLFYDTFDVNVGLWEVFSEFENAAQVTDGKLAIQVGQPGQVALSLASFTLEDFDLKVSTAQVSGPDANGYGIVFRYLAPDDFYRFDIAGDGYWGLSYYRGGIWQPVVPFSYTPAINTGPATNDLRVHMRGGQLALYANDILLLDTQIQPGDGRIGLFASAFDQGGVHITFDELVIREP